MLSTMVDEENLEFRLVKMVKFGFLSMYFTHLKLPILKLIFHLHDT